MKEPILLGLLLGLCILLLGAVIVIGWLYTIQVQTKQQAAETKIVFVEKEVATPQRETSGMPIYPAKDPVYPLRTVDTDFQQIGTLTNMDDKEPLILPLFGRPMPTRKERWEYYTATDKYHMLKIPVMFEQRDCLEEVGCREVYNKDAVFIPAYQKEFKVQLYKYRDMNYNPNFQVTA
jgi:hypothetical protein